MGVQGGVAVGAVTVGSWPHMFSKTAGLLYSFRALIHSSTSQLLLMSLRPRFTASLGCLLCGLATLLVAGDTEMSKA